MRRACRRAQSILEYALILAVVSAALSAMSIYVQRAVQANIKVIEEQTNAKAVEVDIEEEPIDAHDDIDPGEMGEESGATSAKDRVTR
ncbi:MAG: hypothetical protein KKC84_00580 [Candidatus Omnitrophica bacterium]|nr:hypothetical protein [Candidatus Omnitrophota bacterium]